ncbi:MAG: hypothetical protein A2W91_05820 [Bacteroidetes bacterium GWF2_38_335]|nr:MAG: hypothetical protein A2W91_05820 [Bacteroidetes bacterium GWF2_38_335]OFY81594.1 MAG: hypothetical protein A2281_11615 [Bacteroidetes bacterium RIFOXYA12_FULL_38_20]HBS88943.1 hypothetical protein [Bacteroidales bacterium]
MKIFLLIISVLSMLNLSAQTPGKMKSAELSKGIFLHSTGDVNLVSLSGPDGTFLVDAGWDYEAPALKTNFDSLKTEQPKYIVSTHWHLDHVFGNKAFTDAFIIAHVNTKKYVSADQTLFTETIKALPLEAQPNMTIKDTVTLYLNGETIKIIPIPGGHTGTDMLVYFEKANILHVGDLIFADMFPFVDVNHGGNVLKARERIKEILNTFPKTVRIIPGHGRELSVSDLSSYIMMYDATIKLVKEQKQKGKTMKEIQDMKVLKDFAKWEKGFGCDQWIEYIYLSL